MFRIRCKSVQKWPSYGQKCVFQYGGRRHLDFCRIWVLRVTAVHCPGTLFSVSVSNLVKIRSKMAELWPFNGFQTGGRSHLGFLHYVDFDGKSHCGTPFSTHVSNLVQIRLEVAELWPKMCFSKWRPPPSWIYFRCLFLALGRLWIVAGHVPVKFRVSMWIYGWVIKLCPKNKMAAAAILNCYFVAMDHPRSLLHGPNIVLKFHVNRFTTAAWDCYESHSPNKILIVVYGDSIV